MMNPAHPSSTGNAFKLRKTQHRHQMTEHYWTSLPDQKDVNFKQDLFSYMSEYKYRLWVVVSKWCVVYSQTVCDI